MEHVKKFEPFFGEWYAESFIGAGSFGRVYKIYREELGERYYSALKYISVPADESEVVQLRLDGMNEASIAAYYDKLAQEINAETRLMHKLRGHSNIVSFEDSKVTPKPDGIGYDILIRMELLTPLPGRLLKSPLSSDETVKLGVDICSALSRCAGVGIIHRDIKPDNVFISDAGDFKLGDFGIARQLEKSSDFMSKKGTYSYMAPEVFKGEKYGANCDIYSLGILMYRLLNGGLLPFLPSDPNKISPEDKEAALSRRMSGEALPAPRYAYPELAAIVLKACAFDPKERYADADQMKRALLGLNHPGASGAACCEKAVTVCAGRSGEAEGSAPADSTEVAGENTPALLKARRFCGNCGALLSEDEMFCPKCGSPARQKAKTAQQADPIKKASASGVTQRSAPETKDGNKKNKKTGLIIGIAVGAAALALILGLLALLGVFGGKGDDDPDPTRTPKATDAYVPQETPDGTTLEPEETSYIVLPTAAPDDTHEPSAFTAASTSTEGLIPVTTVSSAARDKYSQLLGGGQDKVTVMIYMCGSDSEEMFGLATNDLTEMLNAKGYLNDDKVNIIVETGGCRQWNNSIVSNSSNQRCRVTSKGLQRLQDNLGKKAMTDPNTLTDFINYCKKNYPANRYMLILWGNGGGSIAGWGYDQFASGSMTLDKLDIALTNAGVKFDFIGFDSGLMATFEAAVVCEKHADYLIASEETEPGSGWFYTDWLAKLSQNTSINTVELAKAIIDDFNEVCRKNNCGDAATLSITDLAEFKGTVPDAFGAFAASVTEMLRGSEYHFVADARNGAREFGSLACSDQIDLIHFAALIANSNASGADEAKALVKALQGCVKYNRTSTAMKNSYGMSIYFPYKNYRTINSALSVYNAIGMDTRYSTAIKCFASLTGGGQLAYDGSAYDSLFGELPSSVSSSQLLERIVGGYLSGSGSSELDNLLGSNYSNWFDGRLVLEHADYYDSHEIRSSDMRLVGGALALSEEKWALVRDVQISVFCDYGDCYVDLGMDRIYDANGNWMVNYRDGVVSVSHPDGKLGICCDKMWMTINGEAVPYYYVGTVEDNGHLVETGYVPALLKSEQFDNTLVYLIVVSEDAGDYYIAGARYIYQHNNNETETMAKGLIELTKGDRLTFVSDCYSHSGEFQSVYELSSIYYDPDDCTVGYMEIDGTLLVTYCLTDIYNSRFRTESVEYPA